jgi:hypothetical protein
MTRLDTISTQLVTALRQASEERQRSACLAACEFAVQRVGINSPVVADALQTLRAKEPLATNQKAALDALAGKLDDEYFELQEAAEDGKATDDDYMRPFGQSRAVTALSSAANRDAFEAAAEAIYEAATATDDRDGLIADIMITLA